MLWETTTLFSKQNNIKFARMRDMQNWRKQNKTQPNSKKAPNQRKYPCQRWNVTGFKVPRRKEKKKYCSISSVQSTWQALFDVSWKSYKEFRDKERKAWSCRMGGVQVPVLVVWSSGVWIPPCPHCTHVLPASSSSEIHHYCRVVSFQKRLRKSLFSNDFRATKTFRKPEN